MKVGGHLHSVLRGEEGAGLQEHFDKDVGAVFVERGVVEVGIDLQRLTQFLDGYAAEGGIEFEDVLRQDADVVRLLEDVHDGVDVVDERDDVEIAGFGVDETFDGVAIAQAFLRENEFVGDEVGETERLFRSQRMALAHDGGEAVLEERNGGDKFVGTRRHHGEHDVYLASAEHAEEVAEAFVVGVDFHLWVARHEGEHRFADVGFEAEGEADVEGPAQESFEIGDAVVALGYSVQHPLCDGQQGLSAFGECDAVRLTREELCVEFFFEEFDLLGHGALCNKMFL